MKLDKKVVNRRVELMEKRGALYLNFDTEIGKNYPAVKLVNEFDAVVLCTGSTKTENAYLRRCGLKGCTLCG